MVTILMNQNNDPLNAGHFDRILTAFHNKFETVFEDDESIRTSVVAVHATTIENGDPVIRIGLSYGTNAIPIAEMFQEEPLEVQLSDDSDSKRNVPFEFSHEPPARLMMPDRILPGSLAQPEDRKNPNDATLRGTGGWGFLVDVAVPPADPDLRGFVLTSWHVVDSGGPPTGGGPKQIAVGSHQVGHRVAIEKASWPPVLGASPTWDFSALRVDDLNKLRAEFMKCYQGHNHEYPVSFTAATPTAGDLHYMISNTYPHCVLGKYVGNANMSVEYPGGATVPLNNQLEFEMLVEPGDSGAVIVDYSNHSVTGLLVAAQPETRRAIANPIYDKGWAVTGTQPDPDGNDLPVVDPGETDIGKFR